jgi:MFS family permease
MSLLARLRGPGRAVPVFGVTQILAWGSIFYSPVLLFPLMAQERGWSIAFAMSGVSVGLLAGGLASPRVGAAIDRHGGHYVMAAGSLLAALCLLALPLADSKPAFIGIFALLGVAMAASLYDPAFATLTRIFGEGARRQITLLTLIGGLASTVGWPATHFLIQAIGWKGTYFVFAGLMAFVAAPLHAFAIPRTKAAGKPHDPMQAPRKVFPPRGLMFALVAVAFATYLFVPSGLLNHLLAMFDRMGMDRGTAVFIGALFGPAQVAARIGEFALARHTHPLQVARFAMALLLGAFGLLALFGVSTITAALFVFLFGAANGLMTIARGTLALALFGPQGYGHLLGRIAAPALAMQAIAPVTIALAIERASDGAALALAAGFVALSLAAFFAIRRPD